MAHPARAQRRLTALALFNTKPRLGGRASLLAILLLVVAGGGAFFLNGSSRLSAAFLPVNFASGGTAAGNAGGAP